LLQFAAIITLQVLIPETSVHAISQFVQMNLIGLSEDCRPLLSGRVPHIRSRPNIGQTSLEQFGQSILLVLDLRFVGVLIDVGGNENQFDAVCMKRRTERTRETSSTKGEDRKTHSV